jgi:hypothetical protein
MAGFGFAAGLEKAPHIEVADTDYGVLLGARRQADPGMSIHMMDYAPAKGIDPASYCIRPASVLLPHEVEWTEAAREHLVVVRSHNEDLNRE